MTLPGKKVPAHARGETPQMRYTELDLSSSRLDQPRQDVAPARKLLILSPPRTGSYMLCRYMLNAGLGVPHEYFNDIHMYLIGRRSGIDEFDGPKWMTEEPQLLLRYLHHLFSIRTRDGLFAAKIQYRHFHLFLRGTVGRELFRDAAIVYLTREDIVAQAVSLHLAQLSGRWSFEKTKITRPQREKDLRDMAAIERVLLRLRSEETRWEEVIARWHLQPLRLTYEAVRADPAGSLSRIATLCGVAPESLSFDYDDEGRYPVDAAIPDKDDLAAAFRQAFPEKVAMVRPPAAAGRRPVAAAIP